MRLNQSSAPVAACVVSLFCTGCTAERVATRGPFVEADHRPESKPLPPNPREEKLDGEFSMPEWVEAIEQGEAAPRAGILISESRAARDALFRARYDELRRYYDADRMVWGAHRAYYEERLSKADVEIQRLQPTWWSSHAESIFLVGGILVGMAATIGISHAVYASQ